MAEIELLLKNARLTAAVMDVIARGEQTMTPEIAGNVRDCLSDMIAALRPSDEAVEATALSSARDAAWRDSEPLRSALAHTGKPTVKPLDLSNLLKHAFGAGYTSAAGDDGWTDYDPTTCPAYARILSALQTGGET